jgi:hypothetical protein
VLGVVKLRSSVDEWRPKRSCDRPIEPALQP